MNPPLLLLIIIQLLAGPPLDVRVDQNTGLPAWYDPGLHPAAIQAMDSMQQDAFTDGIRLSVYSGYRSYQDQNRVVQRELATNEELADRYLARAGHSEHQLGTAFDVVWPGLRVEMHDPRNLELYDWLEANGYRFGFVISYPLKNATEWPFSNRWSPISTEYIYEPWHIRYVGIELAEMMMVAGYLDPASPVLPQTYYHIWP